MLSTNWIHRQRKPSHHWHIENIHGSKYFKYSSFLYTLDTMFYYIRSVFKHFLALCSVAMHWNHHISIKNPGAHMRLINIEIVKDVLASNIDEIHSEVNFQQIHQKSCKTPQTSWWWDGWIRNVFFTSTQIYIYVYWISHLHIACIHEESRLHTNMLSVCRRYWILHILFRLELWSDMVSI